MTTTRVLGQTLLTESGAGNYAAGNQLFNWLDALNGGTVGRFTAAEPGSPTEGDAYILPASPTGSDWGTNGTENDLALFINEAWLYLSPGASNGGISVYDRGTALRWTWTGSKWAILGEQLLAEERAAPTNTATAAGTAIDSFTLPAFLLEDRTVTIRAWADNGSSNAVSMRLLYGATVVAASSSGSRDTGMFEWKLWGTAASVQAGNAVCYNNAPDLTLGSAAENSETDLALTLQMWATSGGTNTLRLAQYSISEAP